MPRLGGTRPGVLTHAENAKQAGACRMTRLELRSRNKESLVDMARRRKIAGASKMTRDELITRLLASAPVKTVVPSAQAAKPAPTAAAQMKSSPAKPVAASNKPKKTTKTVKAPLQRQVARDTTNEAARVNGGIMSSAAFQPRHGVAASPSDLPRSYGRDRLVLLVRDPFWLHCYWEISSQTTRLAEAALGVDWLTARRSIRLVSVGGAEGTSSAESIIKDITLPDESHNWYIDVPRSGGSYQVEIGFKTPTGRFYSMARSNAVCTPQSELSTEISPAWTEQDHRGADRLYALSTGMNGNGSSAEVRQFFEGRMGRVPGSPTLTSLGSGGFGHLGKGRNFFFNIDADLIVYGSTEPNARVTFQGEPVTLRPDGTFSLRFRLADGRHILPALAVSATGMEERTVVLAVERNTKSMEPIVHEEQE